MPHQSETLNDIAISTLTEIDSAQRVANGQNDYGSAMGCCDEMDLIQEDLRRSLLSIRLRAWRLKYRIQKHCEEKAGTQPR